jgi:OHCU decarboxylase
MTRDEFLSRFGTVFENRPDLAVEAWDRAGTWQPAAGAEGLHRAFAAVLRGLPPDALLSFLNDHPDLASRAARPADLTPDSQHEQGSAGLDGLDEAGGARLLELNKAYRERFGFPFIMAVKGRRPDEILTALETRLRNPPAEEREEAVRQVERILLLRLKDRLGEA